MSRTFAAAVLLSTAALTAPTWLGAAPASAGVTDPPTDVAYQQLTEDVYDPMDVQVAPDGRVIVAQRDGKLKIWHQDGKLSTAIQLKVNAARNCVDCAESINDDGGIYSMILDPHFAKNGWVYVWYDRAHSGNPATNLEDWNLSRLTLKPNDTIDPKSEKVLFTAKAWYLDPEGSQAHYGGILEFLPDGTLLLGTGDDTDPKSDGGWGPRDNTKAQGYYWNAELTAQNPASAWGKILRMNPDGTVPDGKTKGVRANPFIGKKAINPYIPDGTNHKMHYYPWGKPFKAKAIAYNPYVYALGFKQPWRGAVDPTTGNLFFSEVGPDAQTDDMQKGPQAYEEVNTLPFGGGGNYGWPRCIGPNLPYHDFDWQNQVDRGVLSCRGMTSPNIWYNDSQGGNWAPYVGVGAKTGEVPAFIPPSTGALALPKRFANNALYIEWSRGFMYGIPVKNGQLDTTPTDWNLVRPPVPGVTFVGVGQGGVVPPQAGTIAGALPIIDAAVGKDGAIYLVEYGSGYGNNPLSRLSRLTCRGCTPNPSRDFVHTAGVKIVSAQQAFVPKAFPKLVLKKVESSSLVTPARTGALAIVGLVGFGVSRRRRIAD